MSSALGLALMTVLATRTHAQLSADRAALVPNTPDELAVHGIDASSTLSLLGVYQELELRVRAEAYSDVFLVAALLTVGALLLAFFIRKPAAFEQPAHPAPAAPVTEDPVAANGHTPVAAEPAREPALPVP
jgi:hypothetical protein